MKLTATPFNPQTGELLPVYRDAYLRGDLAGASARAVEDYLRHDAHAAHGTVTRWHHLQAEEAPAAAPSWVQKQLLFIREQPQRFRRRAASFVLAGALLAGASMAATNLPTTNLPTTEGTELAATTEAGATRLVLLRGRILNEKGLPLVGATVLRKGTAYGASTDADGNYELRVPADGAATLQYAYAGYAEQELTARNAGTVTLAPQPAKRRHWLFF